MSVSGWGVWSEAREAHDCQTAGDPPAPDAALIE